MIFNTDFASIAAQIESIDPIAYAHSRNYIDGAVTYLSPYISRGVISTKQVLDSVMKRGYKLYQIESFVKELCWRDYFQRVGQEKNLSLPIKQAQTNVAHTQIPLAILKAKTGIEGIDQAIEQLYATGYMHNHARMYTASVVCNIAQSDWLMPARWMYYHLLDGDWASNACSWQWVAAANSGKKYYANQENINKYTKTAQHGTFLDKSYEDLAIMQIPSELKTVASFTAETSHQFQNITHNQTQGLTTQLNKNIQSSQDLTPNQTQDTSLNTAIYIYNYYNLDPLWHKDQPGQRILLLEPDFFQQYPISDKCWNFMMQLAAEIPNLQIYYGSFASLLQVLEQSNQTQITHKENGPIREILINSIRYKEHPLNIGYQGVCEPRDWIAPTVQGYYPSFFAYWKAVKKVLDKY
ncbi:MAG: deoxyribodipyrimidine photolyase [Chitinophagaceae bacterium BSSC1]|nr:MAG: deoxyribodipyrimidine photolyase [Chitinophagaceae bacterium BSSC1]